MATSTRASLDHTPSENEHGYVTSSPQSLSKAVHARRAEYTRKKNIKIKIGSWNVAACPGTERDLEAWFVDGKGVDEYLSGVTISDGLDNGGRDGVESVGAQEARANKKESTVPRGDKGILPSMDEIGLYILGLQEVVDLNRTIPYVDRSTDRGTTTKWRKAMSDALPKDYVQIAEQQLSGMLLLIFASPEVAPTISSVSSASIGTGTMGYLGNKGAVVTRMVLGETTRMVFVNSHLASGSEPVHLDRRCWDITQILQRVKFEPISWGGVWDDASEKIGDEDFAFWFGDLNFRLDGLPGDDIRRLLLLHTRGEYDVGQKSRVKIEEELAQNDHPIVIHNVESDEDDASGEEEVQRRKKNSPDEPSERSSSDLPDPDDFVQDPSQDPASLQATLDSLLPHDQLKRMQRQKKAFHDGWREGDIQHLPSYKYDIGSVGMFDSSEKKRAPSWCDRILFRTRKNQHDYELKKQEEDEAREKDEKMKSQGLDHAGDEEDVLFDYNPEEDGLGESSTTSNDDYDEYDDDGDAGNVETITTKEGYEDSIEQLYYTSHQRVLSSDHKPLDSVFSVDYDAIVPELKAKVQQEVARDLDRAENERRPGITIIVDPSQDTDAPPNSPSTEGSTGVDFGNVAYFQRKSRSLTIANTGQVPASFSLVNRPTAAGEGDAIAPPWLSVYFVDYVSEDEKSIPRVSNKEVTLEPGDAVTVTLEVFVEDIPLVQSLNPETALLDDVLVLRVTGGRDHFLPIRGSWLQSCFGRSIDELIRVPEGGVRSLMPSGPGNRGQSVCWSTPRELFKLTEAVEALTERVIADAYMIDSARIPLESAGWPFDSNAWLLEDAAARESRKGYIIEALDSDQPLNESFPPEIPAIEKLEITAEVLLMFLNSLTDGIVPEHLWAKLEADINTRTAHPLTDPEEVKTWVLDVLSTSPNHNISFVFLTSMLARVAAELAPVPKYSWRGQGVRSARSSMETVRRSLSWKGRVAAPTIERGEDPAVVRRVGVEGGFLGVWRDVIFRGAANGVGVKERERREMVLRPFLRA
ncbi:Endonuclease/exonuclease/phosphatase [Amylocarpus encephaloides]|uniref:Endonuclease/exonuclease/phosphatase n=1 Tax=Amylocarpus encephaloides TaxID=45428 RepID=A0A9P8C975_9HELO|nr:Endonuclease/exonuclease/phosphatase [Amylocarpus encephaloides]